jgi:hypothetical protein
MNQIDPKMILQISSSLEIDLPPKASNDEILSALTDRINYLITHDFNKLVAALYRIDISEKQLKGNLETKEKDAGAVIAEMIIQRQVQKIKTKEQFKSRDDVANDEKW